MSVRVRCPAFGQEKLYVTEVTHDETLLSEFVDAAKTWPSAYEARLDLQDFPGAPWYNKLGYVYEELP